MSTVFSHASEAADFLRGRLDPIPEVAIVLGSGLGAFAEGLQDATPIAYSFIPHWPVSGVVGHAGKLVWGASRGKRVLALSGRAHFYEGHSLERGGVAVGVVGGRGV